MPEQKNNPLHGKTLEMILEHLLASYGWEELGSKINIKCFNENPSIKSSLTFLRKTAWARAKVESLYLYTLRKEKQAEDKSKNTKLLFFFFLFIALNSSLLAQTEKAVKWKKVQVLVYTKNGKGFVHDNIPFAVACIQKLGQVHGFKVDVSDNPSVFTSENLLKYNCLIFTSTNNDVFDTDSQRLAFRHYIESGGGLVGIHAIMGTERNWTWFKQLIGGSFAWHARFQKYRVKVIDPNHASVVGLPLDWERADECYFEKEIYPTIHPFLVQDVASLQPADVKEQELIKQHNGSFGNYYPAAWHHFFDGGLAWITTLGHDKKDYEEPVFVKHIFQGIEYVVKQTKKRDLQKAYAENRDTPLKISLQK